MKNFRFTYNKDYFLITDVQNETLYSGDFDSKNMFVLDTNKETVLEVYQGAIWNWFKREIILYKHPIVQETILLRRKKRGIWWDEIETGSVEIHFFQQHLSIIYVNGEEVGRIDYKAKIYLKDHWTYELEVENVDWLLLAVACILLFYTTNDTEGSRVPTTLGNVFGRRYSGK